MHTKQYQSKHYTKSKALVAILTWFAKALDGGTTPHTAFATHTSSSSLLLLVSTPPLLPLPPPPPTLSATLPCHCRSMGAGLEVAFKVSGIRPWNDKTRRHEKAGSVTTLLLSLSIGTRKRGGTLHFRETHMIAVPFPSWAPGQAFQPVQGRRGSARAEAWKATDYSTSHCCCCFDRSQARETAR